MRCFRLHVFLDLDLFRFRFIMYLVVALSNVALVNFASNEYMMMMIVKLAVTLMCRAASATCQAMQSSCTDC